MPVRQTVLFALILTIGGVCGVAYAQLPVTPSPPPCTLWSFLGIPQKYRRVHDSMANHFGKHPALERKPPLKALADPANLESEVPAIKAAAEIKQAEDLKPQKIKALKYLGQMGCGCYDKDGKVTDAFLAAMGDCTEDVRAAAVEAITEGAQSERCEKCKQRSCCSEKISKQLAKLAYERDEKGCYVEPSERVRQAAIQALSVCCVSYGAPLEEPTPKPEVEKVEGPSAVESPEMPETTPAETPTPPPPKPITDPAEEKKPADAPADEPRPAANPANDPAPDAAPAPNELNTPANEMNPAPSAKSTTAADQTQADSSLDMPPPPPEDEEPVRGEPGSPSASAAPVYPASIVEASISDQSPATARSAAPASDAPSGAVVAVDAARRQAHVHFLDKQQTATRGAHLQVYQPSGGKYLLVGELEVLESSAGTALVRPSGGWSIAQISRGAVVVGP